jgi:nucleoside permease NupC
MGTIEITPLYLVLAGVIGLLIGLLIANIFSGKESRVQKADQPPKDLQKEGFVDAVNLWYSPAGKKIVTQLDGLFTIPPIL